MGTGDEITYAEVFRVLESIKATSQFEQIHLKFGDIEIDLCRGSRQPLQPSIQPAQPTSSTTSPPLPTVQPSGASPTSKLVSVATTQDALPAPHAQLAAAPPPNSILVRSPMVGTFYRRPSPEAAPFVEVGQEVEAGSTLCIIEVMKLMTSINASVRGKIIHIMVANAELVEPDQVLMVIEPL